jgi:hypothetical protein
MENVRDAALDYLPSILAGTVVAAIEGPGELPLRFISRPVQGLTMQVVVQRMDPLSIDEERNYRQMFRSMALYGVSAALHFGWYAAYHRFRPETSPSMSAWSTFALAGLIMAGQLVRQGGIRLRR